MVTDFKKYKLLHHFNSYDTGNNGVIDKEDIETSITRISQKRGIKPGDAKFKKLEDALLKIWSLLQNRGDLDKDGEVSLEDWNKMWEDFEKDPAGALEWQNSYCQLAFIVQDANENGEIEEIEYVPVAMSFGMDKDNAVKSFRKIAKGKQTVTWPAYQELWREYLTTDDPHAPGNFIFGHYKTDS